MSDLVERLQGAYSTVFERSMAKEAADEIIALRKRVEELERANASLTYENVELRSWTRARESEIIDRGGRNIEAMKRLCAEFKSESAAKDAEIIALRKQVEELERELAGWKRMMDEALNSGDGSYRP